MWRGNTKSNALLRPNSEACNGSTSPRRAKQFKYEGELLLGEAKNTEVNSKKCEHAVLAGIYLELYHRELFNFCWDETR